MDRRSFLKTTGAAVSTAALATAAEAARDADDVAAPSLAKGRIELRMATHWPSEAFGLGDSSERLARTLRDASDGRLTVRLVWSEEAGTPEQIAAAVAAGELDLYHGTEGFRVDAAPAFGLAHGVPAGPSGADLALWLAVGGGQPLWDDMAAAHGIKPLLAGRVGASSLWHRRGLHGTGPSGLRVGIDGLAAELVRARGAKAVAVPIGERAGALDQGRVDLLAGADALTDAGLGLHRVAACRSPGLHGGETLVTVGVGRKTWYRLDDASRSLLALACSAESRLLEAEMGAHEAIARQTMATAAPEMATPAWMSWNQNDREIVLSRLHADRDGRRLVDAAVARLWPTWASASVSTRHASLTA